MDDHRLYEIYKYRRISDRIATAGQPTEAQLAAIAKAGCTTVINLGLHDTAYALSDERSLVESLGIKYVYIPVRWDRPDKAALVRFCDVLEAHEDQDVFIHCKANLPNHTFNCRKLIPNSFFLFCCLFMNPHLLNHKIYLFCCKFAFLQPVSYCLFLAWNIPMPGCFFSGGYWSNLKFILQQF